MRQNYFKNGLFCGANEKSAFSGSFIKTVFLGLSLLLCGAAAHAQTLASLPVNSAPISSIGVAKPILGWSQFCEQFRSECTVDVTEADKIDLTPQAWKTIVSVNQRVNSSIKAVTDADHFGVVDTWGFPDDGKGDCEDFQLLKRRLLVAAGLPRRAMRMTVVIDELGEGHAVLMVRTSRGDFVLDNKTSSVLPWHRTGYVYIKRESQDATGWVSLGGIVSSPTTTANR
ncbi:transglutaminase-like cysteine peptidase [Microvirga terrestris]|uniref:Transglutaminase-like cysteine peptidase n=1 Tax=Microvirga terrestris TaxID=2791024 RepID=A0ABS0HMY4_9HYPH|nr:transglutaminase-like cysteine peptidase [Microvirga terrestris]MBF9194841.1 transglutaminase-like cysteine peptidase [Microvirga terrestris]